MKSFRSFVLALTLLAVAPIAAAADFGVRAGKYNDIEDEFVGVEAVFGEGAFRFNPNVEYILTDVDGVTAGTANADFTWNFTNATAFTPWVGAGLGLFYIDDDFFGESTDTTFNALAGVSWNLDFVKPYAQVKYFRAIEDDAEGDDVAFAIGVRF